MSRTIPGELFIEGTRLTSDGSAASIGLSPRGSLPVLRLTRKLLLTACTVLQTYCSDVFEREEFSEPVRYAHGRVARWLLQFH